jgi:hypothetical protein
MTTPTAGGADMTYVAPPASDAAGQVANPASYPSVLYPEIEHHASGHLGVPPRRSRRRMLPPLQAFL